MSGKYCYGLRILSWADGTDSNYGHQVGITECKTLCSAHSDCAGFSHSCSGAEWECSTYVCGFWTSHPLSPVVDPGHNCYKKLWGNNAFTVPWYFKHYFYLKNQIFPLIVYLITTTHSFYQFESATTDPTCRQRTLPLCTFKSTPSGTFFNLQRKK